MEKGSEEISARVVRKLAAAREAKGLTKTKLAELAQIDRSHLYLIEGGKRRPTLPVAIRIANALGLRLADVLDEVEPRIQREAEQ